MQAAELDMPQRFAMFEEVMNYFGSNTDSTRNILSVINKHPSKDSLQTIWQYVRLEQEKINAIKQLNPQDFAEDIESEIKDGILTLASMNRIKEDVMNKNRKKPNPDLTIKSNEILNTFEQVEGINRALELYK